MNKSNIDDVDSSFELSSMTSGEISKYYEIGKKFAVKFIIKKKLHENRCDDNGYPLEILFLKKLDHRNIVKCVESYENITFYSYTMKRSDPYEVDLFDFVENNNISENLASYIFRQVVGGVNYLHRNYILHRDIKDENILIDSNYNCKIIDFGSACHFKPGENSSTFCGTLEYCAPELMTQSEYCPVKSEIWSLGVLLYTLVCGENPFGDAEEIVECELNPCKYISSA